MFNHLGLLGHKSGENLVVVGGLFDNLIVLLVWESLETKIPEEPEMDLMWTSVIHLLDP